MFLILDKYLSFVLKISKIKAETVFDGFFPL